MAINSMFRWYRNAKICFAYLSDIPSSTATSTQNGVTSWETASWNSRWFTRGWTLQQLIAPDVFHFYGRGWNYVGEKSLYRHDIHSITGIDIDILENSDALPTVPVARRMSWAAKRRITKIEDMAYCLLGIFDVNMPMIYGEGAKAFLKLQEEIAKTTNDLSLFAWTSQAETRDDRRHMHLAREFSITNNGLKIEAFLPPASLSEDYVFGLDCTDTGYVRTRAYETYTTMDDNF
ncbi:hypothetical protein F5Y19DRAFT_478266 [Xylariaceae sp. FL1651]|nr:hypothetical protein F5Y19DRAFT_478266 [Xylariaceae sp. FL1651]